MFDQVGSPDIILVWPKNLSVPGPMSVAGYSVRALPPGRNAWWLDIHSKAVPWFAASDLEEWLEEYRSLALEEGVLVATADATGEPVATAGSLSHDKAGMFPAGGQLGWVATVPEHRGRGLGGWLCAMATARLRKDRFKNLFLCTGEDMPQAIRVYLRLGYVPCLYASDQRDRWAKICEETGNTFEPARWPTRDEYVSS